MDTEDVSDPQQSGNAHVHRAGLDGLVRGPGNAGGEEHLLLGEVLPHTGDANAVTDGEALTTEPGIVIGQVGHSSETRPILIFSQPSTQGLLRSCTYSARVWTPLASSRPNCFRSGDVPVRLIG